MCVVCLGCGGGPRMHEITGNVTYDGDPVAEGEVLFEHTDKTIAPDGATLKDGKYKAKVKEGPHIVRIRASKKVDLPPGKKNGMGDPWDFVSYIPPKYNDKSELTIDVQKSQTADFALKSK
jgi:hypothetical protein